MASPTPLSADAHSSLELGRPIYPRSNCSTDLSSCGRAARASCYCAEEPIAIWRVPAREADVASSLFDPTNSAAPVPRLDEFASPDSQAWPIFDRYAAIPADASLKR